MCAEIQSDSPSPAGWSAADRLGLSALEGITDIEWGQSGGWDGLDWRGGDQCWSRDGFNYSQFSSGVARCQSQHCGCTSRSDSTALCHEATPPPITGNASSSQNS